MAWDHDRTLPLSESQISALFECDDTIVFNRDVANGTKQAGFLASSKNDAGDAELGVAGEVPKGLIKSSERSGEVSLYVQGYNLSCAVGDAGAEAGQQIQCDTKVPGDFTEQTVVDNQALSGGSVTIAVTTPTAPAKLKATLNSSAALAAANTPGTLVIAGTLADDSVVSETLSFANDALTTPQTTTTVFKTITGVTRSGFNAGNFDVDTVNPNDPVKGYLKGVDSGGRGYIQAVIDGVAYFDL